MKSTKCCTKYPVSKDKDRWPIVTVTSLATVNNRTILSSNIPITFFKEKFLLLLPYMKNISYVVDV